MISTPENSPLITISRAEYERLLQTEKDLEKAKLEQSYLRQEIANLKRMLFGKKSERFAKDPTPKPQEERSIPNTATKDTASSGHRREPIPANLPREEVIIEPEENTEGLTRIGMAESEYYAYIPGKLVVIRVIRPKYLNKETGEIIIAPMPVMPIPYSNAGASILAHIAVSKFVDHQPLYRQSQILKRNQGVHLAESTLNGWFSGTCNLLDPLYDTLKTEVQASPYLQADETPIPVLTKDKPGSTHKGYQWVYHSYPKKLVCFDYHKSRSREGPSAFLKDFSGTLQTDAYQAYDLFEDKENVELLACWAHARRYFEKALDSDKTRAAYALSEIRKLYAIEGLGRDQQMTPDQIQLLRVNQAVPILSSLKAWIEQQQPDVLPKSPIGKAFAYSLSLWDRLERYTKNGHWLIDNNLIENTIRPVTLGRKNYLFAGSHAGAARAAMMYSFFGSCKLNGINPWEWLSYVLSVIPNYKVSQLKDLLPSNYKKQS